jgi:hypothetical protein
MMPHPGDASMRAEASVGSNSTFEGRLRHSESGTALTDAGRRWLGDLGFAPQPPRAGQRFAYGCLDWSQRRDPMAGSLARQLLDHFIAQGWVRKRSAGSGSHRVPDHAAGAPPSAAQARTRTGLHAGR